MLNYLQQNTPTVLAFGIRKKPTSVFHVETKMPLIFIYSTFNFPPIQFQPICFDTFCFVLLFSPHFRCYHKYVKCLASWRVSTGHLWYIFEYILLDPNKPLNLRKYKNKDYKHKQRPTFPPPLLLVLGELVPVLGEPVLVCKEPITRGLGTTFTKPKKKRPTFPNTQTAKSCPVSMFRACLVCQFPQLITQFP